MGDKALGLQKVPEYTKLQIRRSKRVLEQRWRSYHGRGEMPAEEMRDPKSSVLRTWTQRQ